MSVTLRDCSQFSQLMQQDFRSSSHFSQRTEFLANQLGLMLGDVPAKMGISERMFYGYRSGKYPLTDKAWRKLEEAEEKLIPETRSFRSDATPPPSAPPRSDSSDAVATREFLAVLERMAEALEGKRRAAEELLPVYERMAAALERLAENGNDGA